jgi:hypothetical protein
MSHPNQLIAARAALWAVIEGLDYESIGGELSRKVKFADKQSVTRKLEPSVADLPMVAAIPLGVSKKLETTARTGMPYKVLVRVWSDSWVPDYIDRFLPEFLKAMRDDRPVAKFRPVITASYVQTHLTGDSDSGPRVTRCDIMVELNVCL